MKNAFMRPSALAIPLVLLIATSVAAVAVLAMAHAGGDVAPPALVDLDFSPTTVDVTGGPANVTLTFQVTDDQAGLQSGVLEFHSPSPEVQVVGRGFTQVELLSGDDKDGTYQLTVTIPQFSEAGTWNLARVFLLDKVSNAVGLTTAEVTALGFPTQLTVISTQDASPPQLVDLDFSPTTVDVTGGPADVTLTFQVTDDLAGLQSGVLEFHSPSPEVQVVGRGFTQVELLSGDNKDGTYQLTVTIPQFSKAGTWNLARVFLLDKVSNAVGLTTAEVTALGFPTQLTVISTQDASPPQLVDLDFSPTTVDVTGGPANVTLTFQVTDDLAGLQSGVLEFHSPSPEVQVVGRGFTQVELLSGDDKDGTYQLTMTIPQFSEAGTWNLARVFLLDKVSNAVGLTTAELAALGFPTQLTVGPVFCNGLEATIVGTSGSETITGTSGDDVIVALDGDDVINGMGGNDSICAGGGDDLVHGGPGNDWVFGEEGHDTVVGGKGNDRLYGGTGADLLRERRGHDRLYGEQGHDVVVGGAGNDKLFGGVGADVALGRGGDDTIKCGPGSDFANGGLGSDTAAGNCETTVGIP